MVKVRTLTRHALRFRVLHAQARRLRGRQIDLMAEQIDNLTRAVRICNQHRGRQIGLLAAQIDDLTRGVRILSELERGTQSNDDSAPDQPATHDGDEDSDAWGGWQGS